MNIIFIIILSLFILPQLPWWTISFLGSAIGFTSKSYTKSLIIGFIYGSTTWLIVNLHAYYSGAELLMTRVSGMLGYDGWVYSLLVSIIIGGIAGSLGSLSGYSFKRAFKDQLNKL